MSDLIHPKQFDPLAALSGQVLQRGSESGPIILAEPAECGEWNARNGDTATSSSNLSEPSNFGQAGVLLPRYRTIEFQSLLAGGRRFRKLKLKGNITLVNTDGINLSYVKIGARFEHSTTPFFTDTQSSIAVAHLNYDLDLLPLIQEDIVDGDLIMGLFVWSVGGTARIGNSSVTEPNPSFGVSWQIGL